MSIVMHTILHCIVMPIAMMPIVQYEWHDVDEIRDEMIGLEHFQLCLFVCHFIHIHTVSCFLPGYHKIHGTNFVPTFRSQFFGIVVQSKKCESIIGCAVCCIGTFTRASGASVLAGAR